MNTPGNTVAELGERGIIEAIRLCQPPRPAWLVVGIGDDAAVVKPERGALEVLTTDALVEGIHFDRRFSTAYDIGWKALAVNLSDIASMGAAPRLALLSLALPAELPLTDFDSLVEGFLELAVRERVTLAGGNITRSPGPLMVDVTVTGTVRPRRILTRAGARPGDEVYVTGTVGTARAELERFSQTLGSWALGVGSSVGLRYRRPDPRCRVGALLGRNRAASACMDLSDGLADAVRQVAEASGAGIELDAALLPIDPIARDVFTSRGTDPIVAAVAGGDDYELLFTVPKRARRRLETVRQQARGVPLTRIGSVTAVPGARLSRDGVSEPVPEGFVHF